MTNYRSIPTCPHSVIEPIHVKVNNIMQYFCKRCGELVCWSVPDKEEQLVEGEPRQLTEEEQKELA